MAGCGNGRNNTATVTGVIPDNVGSLTATRDTDPIFDLCGALTGAPKAQSDVTLPSAANEILWEYTPHADCAGVHDFPDSTAVSGLLRYFDMRVSRISLQQLT